jgi:hypothetical protein
LGHLIEFCALHNVSLYRHSVFPYPLSGMKCYLRR